MSLFINFQSPYAWQELNDEVDEVLGLKAQGGSAKVVSGVRTALAEITLGLARQFPHRRQVAYVRGLDPGLEGPATSLAREGCTVQALDAKLLSDKEALSNALAGDCLLVLASEDDPLLGVLHSLENLEAVCESKKIHLVRVSHAHHRYLPHPAGYSRLMIRVHALSPQLALVLTSSRLKWPLQFADTASFPHSVLGEIARLKAREYVDPYGVEKFEAEAPGGSRPVFEKSRPRVLDRALLYWPDVEGLALLTRLCARLKRELPARGENTFFETTSLNRWGGVKTMDWLRDFGFSDEMIRGTVIFDHRVISPELPGHLAAVTREIRAEQTG